MNELLPKPMPEEIKRAYRDPLNLRSLLTRKNVFSPDDLPSVTHELLRRLIRKYGVAEVVEDGELIPITDSVFVKKDYGLRGVDAIMRVNEYGGEEESRTILAAVMQPYWHRWWNEFSLAEDSKDDPLNWSFSARHVLGDRQLRWIAAQCARASLEFVGTQDRQACLGAIRIAEQYAITPTSDLLREMKRTFDEVLPMANSAFVRSRLQGNAATACAQCIFDTQDVIWVVEKTIVSGSIAMARGSSDPYAQLQNSEIPPKAIDAMMLKLANLIRKIITPTLITTASRGLQ